MNKISCTDEMKPPLPPRPRNISSFGGLSSNVYEEQQSKDSLLSGTTTAVSPTAVNTYTVNDGSRRLHLSRTSSRQSLVGGGVLGSPPLSDAGDSSSLYSSAPRHGSRHEVRTLFGNNIPEAEDEYYGPSPQHDIFSGNAESGIDGDLSSALEFGPVPTAEGDGSNFEPAHSLWKTKMKHFIILSAAGKPIFTRHGSDAIISSYVGIIQTIISFYQSSGNLLRSFSCQGARFVILSQTNLFLVAISRLDESDTQLRLQLEALYMQILSTLTLPNLTHIFSVRPSSDLRRPLQGTESLLCSLADSFTRGSPTTLLSALESLKLRKSHRAVINTSLLKSRVDELLYGLVVAGGRLVSVIRPKKHSLHPSDMQLIFNMLFEAEGVKAGGGESWIPICLPAFNPNGYLYLYVSFLNMADRIHQATAEEMVSKDDGVAIILISAEKESFESLRSMRRFVIDELGRNRSLSIVQSSIQMGRPLPTDIVPGIALRHFLYKSKANVQFFMTSLAQFGTFSLRRRLFTVYHELHASVHTKHVSVKVHHSVNAFHNALAWVTPTFELYCVAGPTTGRNAIVHGANKVVKWIEEQEQRIFIVGGAVF
jgi:vacuolar fusion protein MON1